MEADGEISAEEAAEIRDEVTAFTDYMIDEVQDLPHSIIYLPPPRNQAS